MARTRLFCFPYAGAGASVYRRWATRLPKSVEVLAAQLPGREDRIGEPTVDDWETLVSSVIESLGPHSGLRYALFGHSMGAVVAFEVARALRKAGRPGPAHLFVSGRRPGSGAGNEGAPLAGLPDADLVRALERTYGSIASSPALAHPEVRELTLPVLRADVALLERYLHREEPPLGCPLTAYGGQADPSVSPEQLQGWQSETSAAFRSRAFPGGHFFVESSVDALLVDIAQTLGREEAAS